MHGVSSSMHPRWYQRFVLGAAAAHTPSVPFARTLERQIADIMAQVSPRIDSSELSRRVVSVLAVRISGYASLCERVDPTAVDAILEVYVQTVTDSAGTFLGTVQGSMADVVVATWNAVTSQPEHALLAVNAALDMVDRVDDVNLRLGPGLPPINYAVGINTGDVLVRRTGVLRSEYEVIGDTVNVALLLSAMALQCGILVAEGTRASIGSTISFRGGEQVMLPGKEKPVRVFEVVSGEV
jgi:adenylate cyclase